MIKYIVLLVLLAIGAGALMYMVGPDAQAVISSAGPLPHLNFEATLSWRFIISAAAAGLVALLIVWSILVWIIRLPGRLMGRDDE